MQNKRRLIWILVWWMAVVTVYAASIKPLPVDQAFQFSYETASSRQVVIKWKIAPGYYLYQQRFQFVAVPAVKFTARLPAPTISQRHTKNGLAKYAGDLSIPLTMVSGTLPQSLQVTYQGCAEAGFCYPPVTKTISLNTIGGQPAQGMTTLTTLTKLVSDQAAVSDFLAHKSIGLVLLLFFGLGLLLSFTPCVLPMIPILTSIIVGQHAEVNTRKAFLLSVSYVLGTSVTYSAAGVLAALLGSSLQVWLQQPVFIIFGAAIFVLLALSLFGLFDLTLPKFIRHYIVALSGKQKSGAYAGVFLMGVLSTLLVSPCVTAPLVGVLLYIATTGNLLLGASALFVISIGMGIPLIIIGSSTGKWLPKRGPWMKVVSQAFGLLMLGMAVWLLSRITTMSLSLLLYGCLLLVGSIMIAFYLPRFIGWKRLNQFIGAVTGIVSLVFILFAVNPGWLAHQQGGGILSSQFVVVNNTSQLNQALLSAAHQQKPVLVDFYADWCEACIEMEKNVFDQTSVKEMLKNFMLVRVDLSDNSTEDQTILKHYDVIAPPTVLLFNQKGEENNKMRIIGAMSAREFMSRIRVFAEMNCNKKAVC